MKRKIAGGFSKLSEAMVWSMSAASLWRCTRGIDLYRGGAYLLAFIVSLFFWGIPLRKVEEPLSSRGKLQRSDALEKISSQVSWWRAWVSLALGAYLSVVVGLALMFSLFCLSGSVAYQDANLHWYYLISSPVEGPIFQLLATTLALAMVFYENNTSEKFIKRLLPWVAGLWILGGAASIPNNVDNLTALLVLDAKQLLRPIMWLDALIQSAWITGAGWLFSKEDREEEIDGVYWGIAGVLAVLGCALTVITKGQTDPWHPGIFFLDVLRCIIHLPRGEWITSAIFLVTGISGIILLSRIYRKLVHLLMENGIKRNYARAAVALGGLIMGLLSATNIEFLLNQDLVWGGGLLISGLLVTIEVKKTYNILTPEEIIGRGTWEELWSSYAPKAMGALLIWWLFRELLRNHLWWNPFLDSPMTALVQWCFPAALIILGHREEDPTKLHDEKRDSLAEGELYDSEIGLTKINPEINKEPKVDC